MGQKVHPYGFRLGYNKDWHSHWFAKKQFGDFLIEDLKLKRDLKQRFAGAGVSHVDVERAANRLKIIIYTSRPGIIIGRKGSEIDKLKGDISSRTGREVLVWIHRGQILDANAAMARGTGTDPINDTRPGQREGRPRPARARRERPERPDR